MTEVEKFLAKEPLFRCDRLNASITKKQCAANRSRQENASKDIWSVAPCKGCPGLGDAVVISMEVSDMSTRCKVEGCTKTSQKGRDGMCCTHFNEGVTPAVKVAVQVAGKKYCTVEGCTNVLWKEGTCWRHHPDHIKKRESRAAAVTVIDHVKRAALVQVKEVVGRLCDECGAAPCTCVEDVFGVAAVEAPVIPAVAQIIHAAGIRTVAGHEQLIMSVLREAWLEKEREWLAALSGLRPGAALIRGAGMVQALEELGY